MYLNETYSRVRVGKNLSDMFPIRNDLKQGDVLSPLLFNSALVYVYAIRRVQINEKSWKLLLIISWFMLLLMIMVIIVIIKCQSVEEFRYLGTTLTNQNSIL